MQYGIKKKEAPVEDPGLDGRLGRKKKTPEEMEAEANGELPGAAAGEGIIVTPLWFIYLLTYLLALKYTPVQLTTAVSTRLETKACRKS